MSYWGRRRDSDNKKWGEAALDRDINQHKKNRERENKGYEDTIGPTGGNGCALNH